MRLPHSASTYNGPKSRATSQFLLLAQMRGVMRNGRENAKLAEPTSEDDTRHRKYHNLVLAGDG
jgi:hypothetical protein